MGFPMFSEIHPTRRALESGPWVNDPGLKGMSANSANSANIHQMTQHYPINPINLQSISNPIIASTVYKDLQKQIGQAT